MDTPPIIWTDEDYRWVARFQGCPKELAFVRQPITLEGWNLHLCVIVPWQRAWHTYTSKEKAMLHAERWLRPRYQRILDDMPKPYRSPPEPPYVRKPEDDIPHPGGRKRVFKARRKPF
jgi:hypothetical protein